MLMDPVAAPPEHPKAITPPRKIPETPAPKHNLNNDDAAQQAIQRGVTYLMNALKKQQDEQDIYLDCGEIKNDVPSDLLYRKALIGWTLLECGVPTTDRYMKEVARYVRGNQFTFYSASTAELAVVILFLDRLGDAEDRPLIESYTMRLIGGQKQAGAWGADSNLFGLKPGVEFSQADAHKFADYLKANAGVTPESGRAVHGLEKVPVYLQSCGVVRWQRGLKPPVEQWVNPQAWDYARLGMPPLDRVVIQNTCDKLSSMFALAALWAARKHNLPVEPSLLCAEHYFRRTQCADGGWKALEFVHFGDVPARFPKLSTGKARRRRQERSSPWRSAMRLLPR